MVDSKLEHQKQGGAPVTEIDSDLEIRRYRIAPGVLAGMTKRPAGNFSSAEKVSPITLDYLHRLIGGKDQEPESFVMRAQEHSPHIYNWSAHQPEERVCDGVIWEGSGLALFFPGGCGGVVFHDPAQNLSGLLHCSWKTVAQRIVTNFTTMWEVFGGSPDTTIVRFLPAICGKCLNFDIRYWESEVRPALGWALAWASLSMDCFVEKVDDKLGFHLMPMVNTILKQSGYDPEDRFICTCHSGEYWCYRHHDRYDGKYRNTAFLLVS